MPTEQEGGARKERYHVEEYSKTVQEVAELHQTSVDPEDALRSEGLTTEEAQRRLEVHGYNELPAGDETPEYVKYAKEFLDPFMLMLLFAGVLSFIAYGVEDDSDILNIYLGAVLVFIVWLNSTISYLQQRAASNIMAQLSQMVPSECKAIRDGVRKDVLARELVPGDIVSVEPGSQVPADLRVIESSGMRLDASSITGENLPYECSSERTDVENITDARNLAFSSTNCVEGGGYGIVIRTGGKTMIGSIARLTAQTSSETTLQKETRRFVRVIGILAFVMAVVFFIIGVAQGRGVLDMFILAFVAVLVANIPQGLPATVTASLAVAATRMSHRNVLVKRLDVVETVGAASVICSDKTGTLTTNLMTMNSVHFAGQTQRLHGSVVRGPPPVWGRPQTKPVWRPEAIGFEDVFTSSGGASAGAGGDGGAKGKDASSSPQKDQQQGQHGRKDSDNEQQAATRALTGATDEAEIEMTESRGHRGSAADNVHQLHTWYSAPFEPLLLVAGLCNAASFEEEKDEEEEEEIVSQLSAGPMHLPSFYIERQISRMRSAHKDGSGGSPINRSKSGRFQPQFRVVRGGAGREGSSIGNATDVAMMRYCTGLIPIDKLTQRYPVLGEIAFSSSRKWAATIVQAPSDEMGADHPEPNVAYVLLKGAPERVMGMCTKYLDREGHTVDITDDHKNHINETYTQLAGGGQRVIGFSIAKIRLPTNSRQRIEETISEVLRGNMAIGGLTFLGMVGLNDPPKPGVDRTVATCRRAGIRIFMVTGDHALTGGAIANEIGMLTGTTRNDVAESRGLEAKDVPFSDPEVKAVVITGHELEGLSEPEWDAILRKKEIVFARTTPEHKQEIVQRLTQMGEVVCVTGDGVNDAPALKEANVGVAMGSSNASDVAREAADCILLDDNISSIVAACEEGRVLFSNLRKTIAYTLTNLEPEIFGVLLNLALQMPVGLTSLQILTLDLGTELLPAISFAYESAEEDIMGVPPRGPDTHLVDKFVLGYSYGYAGIIESLGCFMAYMWAFWRRGVNSSELIFSDEDHWEEDSDPLELENGEILSGEDQERIAGEARGAWYLGLIINQAFHRLAMRTSRESAFAAMKRPNLIGDFGSILAVAIGVIFVYVDAMHSVFETSNVPIYVVTPAIISGLIILITTDLFKYWVRNHSEPIPKPHEDH